ncbi:MAG TPA: universal stress protein [Verrucomicrobiae bacterium]|nr:universal stress protein [Verrucomicrobiae bacterium]
MYKNILLGTDGSPAAAVAADYAIWFAKQLGAHLHVLYITDIRLLEGPWMSDLSGAVGAQPYVALVPQIQQFQRDKAAMILAAADKRCRDAGVTCEAAHETGGLVQTMLDYERRADLVVLGQRGEHAQWSEGMLGSVVERMVRASIKPCLVTPGKFRAVKHMLIAYDGSIESGKALHAGIDLAVTLHSEVTVITVCQRESEETASKVLNEGIQLAKDHGLQPHAQLVHGNPETEILNRCESAKATLIVMGAYGHTRIRELILGSTTSHVLRKARVPVLLVRG